MHYLDRAIFESAITFGVLWVSMMAVAIMILGIAIHHFLRNNSKVIALTTMGCLIAITKCLAYLFIGIFVFLLGFFNLYMQDYSDIVTLAQLTLMVCLLANYVMVAYSFFAESELCLTFHERRLRGNLHPPYYPNYKFFAITGYICLVIGTALTIASLFSAYGLTEIYGEKLRTIILAMDAMLISIAFLKFWEKILGKILLRILIVSIILINCAYFLFF